MQNPTEEKIKGQLNDILTQVAKAQNIEKFELDLNIEANIGDGFTCEIYKGDILNKDNGTITSVLIKKTPFSDHDNNKTILKNEMLFYENVYRVLDHLQKEAGVSKPFNNLPKYFCGVVEPENLYLAMEDLKPLGYVMYDKIKCFDKEHFEMLFHIYGKFHALSYVLRKNDLEKFKNITKEFIDLTETTIEFLDKPFRAAISAAVNALDTEQDKRIYSELKGFEEHVRTIFLKASKYNGENSCLVHGDCWSNNMLFKYSEAGKLLDIKLIDFQLVQKTTPIRDLSNFFYSSGSKPDFDNLDNYLQLYHNSFLEFSKELGVNSDEIFSFNEFKNEWKENALYGVIMGIYVWQIKLTTKDDLTELMNGSKNEKKDTAAEIEKFNLMNVAMEKVYSTDLYKERTTAILRHAVEYGIIDRTKIIGNKE